MLYYTYTGIGMGCLVFLAVIKVWPLEPKFTRRFKVALRLWVHGTRSGSLKLQRLDGYPKP